MRPPKRAATARLRRGSYSTRPGRLSVSAAPSGLTPSARGRTVATAATTAALGACTTLPRPASARAAALLSTFGTKSIPQMGHWPGASRTICGCMGQVYCMAAELATGWAPACDSGPWAWPWQPASSAAAASRARHRARRARRGRGLLLKFLVIAHV